MRPVLLTLVGFTAPCLSTDVEDEVNAFVDARAPVSVETTLGGLVELQRLEELLALEPDSDLPDFGPPAITSDEVPGLPPHQLAELRGSIERVGEIYSSASAGRLDEALALSWRHAGVVERVTPSNALLMGRAHIELARVLALRADYDRARRLYLHALQRIDTGASPGHPLGAQALSGLWRCDFKTGNVRRAQRWIEAALARQLRAVGRDGAACSYLACLGNCAYPLGQVARCEEIFRTVAEWRQALPVRDPNESRELQVLATLLFNRGAVTEAAEYYRESIAVAIETQGDGHPDTARIRSSFARLLDGIGDYEEAEPLTRSAHRTLLDTRGSDHEDTLRVQLNLARLLFQTGQTVESEQLVREVVGRYEEKGIERHSNVAEALGLLSWVAKRKGEAEEAISHALRSLALWEELVVAHHPEISRGHLELGEILLELDRPGEALEHLETSRRITARNYGEHAVRSVAVRAAQAEALAQLGRHDEARAAARAALEDLGEAPAHEERSYLNHVLAVSCTRTHDYDAATIHARRAISIIESYEGPESRKLLSPMSALAFALEQQGQLEEATAIRVRALTLNARWRSDTTGRVHHRAVVSEFHHAIASDLALNLVALGRPEEAFDAAEDGRGRVLLDLLQRSQLELSASDTVVEQESAARANVLREENRLVALRARRDLGDERTELLQRQDEVLRAARRELGSAEAAVLGRLADRWPDARPLPLARLRAELESGEWLLSYTWMGRSVVLVAVPPEPDREPMGFVLAARERVTALEAQVRDVRARLERPAASDAEADAVREEARSLTGLLFPPALRSHLAGARRVVVLPHGPLVDIPFEALVFGSAEAPTLLLDEVDEVVVAPSANVYFNRRRVPAAKDGIALLVGDVDFGEGIVPDGTERERESALERLRLFGGTLEPLPGSRDELDRLSRALEGGGVPIVRLTGSGATVGALEGRLAGERARYLHVASHGLPGTAARPYDAALALAPPELVTPDDMGFLTLDRLLRRWGGRLAGCDLVVLSACDTQRRTEVAASDLSLHWGFFHAGAPTVVASLWRVDDEATSLLMARFYQNLLGAHDETRAVDDVDHGPGAPMTKARALVEAKRWLRGADRRAIRSARARGGETPEPIEGAEADLRPYSDPYYWAGFILIGDPD